MAYEGEDRRSANPDSHTSPCPLLQEHVAVSKIIHADLTAIKQNQEATIELLTIFATTKGFIKGLQILGDIVKWFTLIGGSVAALYWFFKK